MQVNIQKLEKSQIELTIELTVDELKPYLDQAAQEISKEVKIEGFRPGKVPYSILVQKVGAMEVYKVAAEKAVQRTYSKAVLDNKIEAVGQPEISLEKIAPDNPLIYKAKVAILPKVELCDLSKLKVKPKPVIVEDQEVDKTVDDLRKMRAKESLQDKTAGKGDRVELDMQVFVDQIPIEGGTGKKQNVILGDGHFLPEFENNVIGMKAKEEKEFEVKFPKDYFQKNLANKKGTFKVKAHNVYKRELPEANDEFAKSMGEYKNLTDFKQKLKNNISKEKEYKEKERLELTAIEQLLEKSKFCEIPEVMIKNELERMVFELKGSLQGQGFKFEDYLKHLKKTEEGLKSEWREQAIKRVKTALAMVEIIKQENLKVEEKAIDDEVQKIKRVYQQDKKIQKQAESLEFRGHLRTVLLNKKAVEFLLAKAVKE